MGHASIPLALVALVALAGCAGTLHDRLDLGAGLSIEPGMTRRQVEGVLGKPDTVTHDRRCLFARRFWWQWPSANGKSEWAWTDRDPVVVIWLKRDRVVGMGTLPKDGAFPGPHAVETLRDTVILGSAPFPTEFSWHGDHDAPPYFNERRIRRRW
jgi:hypothetical protein